MVSIPATFLFSGPHITDVYLHNGLTDTFHIQVLIAINEVAELNANVKPALRFTKFKSSNMYPRVKVMENRLQTVFIAWGYLYHIFSWLEWK